MQITLRQLYYWIVGKFGRLNQFLYDFLLKKKLSHKIITSNIFIGNHNERYSVYTLVEQSISREVGFH